MTQELQSDEKYCRFCAEIVKLSAVLCKHCKSNLSDISAANTRAQPSDSQQPQSKNSIPNSTNPDYETLVAKAYENVKPITVEELEEELRATEKEKPDSIELAECLERLAGKLKEENSRLLDAANMDARARAIKSSLGLTPDSSRSPSSKRTQHKASDEVVAKIIVAAIVIGVLSLPFVVFQICNSNYQRGIHICIVPICLWIFIACWSLAFIGLIVGIISGKGKDDAKPLIALFAIGYLFGLVQVVDYFVANLSFLGFRHMDATEFFIALGIFGFTVKLVTPAPDETPKQ